MYIGSWYLYVSYDLVDDFYYGNDHPAWLRATMPFLCSTCTSPPPLRHFTIARTLMDAHSHSVLDRSLNWICDFRSIFEVFTTLPIAIISPANCFMTIEEEPRRRDGSFEPRLDRSCSFCLIWTFSAFVGYLRIGRRGDVFGRRTPDPGYIRLRRRV